MNKKQLQEWEINFIEDFEPNNANKEILNWWLQISNRVRKLIEELAGEKLK